MKAFLIACILLATIVFSPLSTCTARELAERDASRGAVDPGKVPTYPSDPFPPVYGCPNPYKRNCGRH
ncbi:hypothetical protein POPTR_017G111225v4 [Populus trichocarpa]|nr:hypothetical protein POPTR_017G111225v4 [Populus trichocarpa]